MNKISWLYWGLVLIIFISFVYLFGYLLINFHSNPIKTVTFQGNIQIGNITYYLINNSFIVNWNGFPENISKYHLDAFTYMDYNYSDIKVYILTNRSIDEIKHDCNFELTHVYWNWTDSMDEQLMPQMNSYDFVSCDALVGNLSMGEGG